MRKWVIEDHLYRNEHPKLLEAFRKCGCDPERGGEVGIILPANRRTIIERGQHGS